MESRPTVAVLGAGWAGLAAAVHLVRRGCRVVLLEKRAVPGGRAYSYTDPETGDILDNGPHIYLGCYTSTLGFLRSIGAERSIPIEPNLDIAYVDPDRGPFRFRCPAVRPPWHLLLGLLSLRGLDRIDRLRALRVGLYLRRRRRSGHADLEQTTLEDWLRRLGQNDAIRRAIWNPIATAALNESPSISVAAVFARVLDEAFLSGRPGGVGIATNGLTEVYGGPALRFLEENRCEVKFRSGVSRIAAGRGGVEHLELADGTRLAADAYLSTLPPAELRAALPPEILMSGPYFVRMIGLTTSPIVSIHLWYDRPILDRPFVGMLGTRTEWLFDRWAIFGARGRGKERPAGPPGGQPGAGLSAVISAAHRFVDRPASDIIAMAEEDIATCFPAARAARLLRARVVKERHATISPRVGSSPLRPGPVGPVPNLFLGGDWTDTGLPGCIEGAVRSGDRAAAAAAGFLGLPEMDDTDRTMGATAT